jgi:CHASE1-domain containing sensor protein
MDLQEKINAAGQVLVDTAIYVAGKPLIDVAEFDRFTSNVVKDSKSIEAIAWAQPVAGEQRAAFESATRVPITESGTDGARIGAAERESYTPIVIQNRFDDQLPSLGFDLAARPINRLAMARARDSGLPETALTIGGSANTGPAFLIFFPVFDNDIPPEALTDRRVHLRGYVVGAFRISDLLNSAIAETPGIPETINFYMSSASDLGETDSSLPHVATYSPTTRMVVAALAPGPAVVTAGYSSTRSFEVKGQSWRIESLF